jgi:hypothetical protein
MLADSHWCRTIEEYEAVLSNNTWDLVPRRPRANVVIGKWIFKHKFKADCSLDRYKAHWVLRGFTHRPEVDYNETFSPVVKPAAVRMLGTELSLSSRGRMTLGVEKIFWFISHTLPQCHAL